MKAWVFTSFRSLPESGEYAPIAWNPDLYDYLGWAPQKAPSSGAFHLQGAVVCKKKVSRDTIKALLTEPEGKAPHVTPMYARPPAAARDYYVLDEKKTNCGDVVEFGEFPDDNPNGKPTIADQMEDALAAVRDGSITCAKDLNYMFPRVYASKGAKDTVLDRLRFLRKDSLPVPHSSRLDADDALVQVMAAFLMTPKTSRTFLWIVDPKGGTGKTSRLRWIQHTAAQDGKRAEYLAVDAKFDISHMIDPTADYYLIDIPRNCDVPYSLIEQIRDGAVTSGKYEGKKDEWLKPDSRMIVCSNVPPDPAKITAHDINIVYWPKPTGPDYGIVLNSPYVGPHFLPPSSRSASPPREESKEPVVPK